MGQFYSPDQIVYSQNMADQPSGTFEYNKNVHEGIYQTFLRNITSGEEEAFNTATRKYPALTCNKAQAICSGWFF